MFVLLLLGLAGFCSCQEASKPSYALVFESPVMVDEGSDFIDTDGIKCERYNETTAYMHGEVVFKKPIHRPIIEVMIYKINSNHRQLIANVDINDLCDELEKKDGKYQKYLKSIKIPEKCPIDVGAIKITELAVDVEEFNLRDSDVGAYFLVLSILEQTGDNPKVDREGCVVLNMDMMIENQS